MIRRRFFWGLSNGVMIFAFSGGFWFGFASAISRQYPLSGPVWLLAAAMFGAALRLRRRHAPGFRLSESLRAPEERAETRRIIRGFRRITAAEGLGVVVAVSVCLLARRPAMSWSAIALVISLHFLPIARLVAVRAYYVTGLAGTVLSLVALWQWQQPHALLALTLGMGALMWGTGLYVLLGAERLAERAVGPRETEAQPVA